MSDPVVLLSTGDVVGPTASTNGSLALFDGTSGKKIKSLNAVITPQALALLDDNNAEENRATIGLDKVDNTSDLNKPVSILQAEAILAGRSLVVGYPVVTGPASTTTGTTITLTASTNNLLAGGSLVNFTWTLPNGTKVVTAGSNNSASLAIAVSGVVGDKLNVSVIATDNLGNSSKSTVREITITDHLAPTAPTTVNLPAKAYQSTTGNTLSITGATTSDNATFTYSITQSGPILLTFSKTTGIANGEVITFSVPATSAEVTVNISVKTVDSFGAESPVRVTALTVSPIPDVPGVAFGGGYYVGKMLISGITYSVVVAPKSSGETASKVSLMTALQWAASLTIGGYNDWKIGSANVMELVYRTCKPNTTPNSTTGNSPYNDPNGVNPQSLPVGTQYTSSNPGITSIAAFNSNLNGPEAFSRSDYYWTSEPDGHYYDSSTYYRRLFTTGDFTSADMTNIHWVRAIRLVPVPN